MPKPIELSKFVFDMPAGMQSVESHQDFMRENAHMALKFPIPELRYYFHPVFPGEQATIFAESHNFKSGFIDFWMSYAARTLPAEKAIIIKINTEDSIESMILSELARNGAGNIDDMTEGIIKDADRYIQVKTEAGKLPIVHIGESLEMDDASAAQLYLSNIIRLIDFARKEYFAEEMQVAAIGLDYIQALAFDPEFAGSKDIEKTRRAQVIQDETRIRRAAKYFKCPVIMAAQARELDRRENKLNMPGYYQVQESTFISQRTDRLYSLAMPKMSGRVGDLMEYGGLTFTVAENQLWIKSHKQKRYKNTGGSFPLLIDEYGNVELDAALWERITRNSANRR